MFKYKRTTGILLAAFLFLTLIPAAAADFPDVPSNHPNYDAIMDFQARDKIEGYPDGTFKPDNTINRAEFTKIITEFLISEETIENCTGNGFPDVPADSWFYKYVCAARSAEIIDGYPDGTFKPANDINFVEAAKMISIAASNPDEPTDIWYESYVRDLADRFMIPTTITNFDQIVTRGEVTEMFFRTYSEDIKASTDYETLAGEAVENSYYSKWAIPTDVFERSLMQEGEDCLWIDAGWTYGGDLLSSLISDETARSLANLNIYTPQYARKVEKMIVNQTHEYYDKDFYAFYMCHITDDVDLISGYLYPQGASSFSEDEHEMGNLSYTDTLLVLKVGEYAYPFDDIPIFGGTATGAEPPICMGEMVSSSAVWECFQGLHVDDQEGVDGSYMKYWELTLDGANPNTWEDVEYLEFL